MAVVTTDNQHYTDIANAIREKNGSTDTYQPADMAGAVQALPTGAADVKRWEFTLTGLVTNSNGIVLQDDWLREHFSDANLCFQLRKVSDRNDVFGNILSNSEGLVSGEGYGCRMCAVTSKTPYPFNEAATTAGFVRLSDDGTVRYYNGNGVYFSDGSYKAMAWLA